MVRIDGKLHFPVFCGYFFNTEIRVDKHDRLGRILFPVHVFDLDLADDLVCDSKLPDLHKVHLKRSVHSCFAPNIYAGSDPLCVWPDPPSFFSGRDQVIRIGPDKDCLPIHDINSTFSAAEDSGTAFLFDVLDHRLPAFAVLAKPYRYALVRVIRIHIVIIETGNLHPLGHIILSSAIRSGLFRADDRRILSASEHCYFRILAQVDDPVLVRLYFAVFHIGDIAPKELVLYKNGVSCSRHIGQLFFRKS